MLGHDKNRHDRRKAEKQARMKGGSKKQCSRLQKLPLPKALKRRLRKQSRVRHGR